MESSFNFYQINEIEDQKEIRNLPFFREGDKMLTVLLHKASLTPFWLKAL